MHLSVEFTKTKDKYLKLLSVKMSRFTDLFQEPTPAPEPVKVEEVVIEKPVVQSKVTKKKTQ